MNGYNGFGGPAVSAGSGGPGGQYAIPGHAPDQSHLVVLDPGDSTQQTFDLRQVGLPRAPFLAHPGNGMQGSPAAGYPTPDGSYPSSVPSLGAPVRGQPLASPYQPSPPYGQPPHQQPYGQPPYQQPYGQPSYQQPYQQSYGPAAPPEVSQPAGPAAAPLATKLVRVEFDLGQYGSVPASYHHIQVKDDLVVLAYDISQPNGSPYRPRVGASLYLHLPDGNSMPVQSELPTIQFLNWELLILRLRRELTAAEPTTPPPAPAAPPGQEWLNAPARKLPAAPAAPAASPVFDGPSLSENTTILQSIQHLLQLQSQLQHQLSGSPSAP